LSRAKDIRLGDIVFAIGNPFGVGETVTQGIVSALNKHSMGINQYENFIQTDASINPGNSGGALVDSRGALIGINSAIISPSGGNDGIGFTIPVDMVRDIVTKLIEDGKVRRGYMGVVISKVTDQMKTLYTHKDGAVITDVQPGSASEKSGLRRGDLIYAVNGTKVDSPSSLQRLIASLKPNEKAEISLERDGEEIKIPITLGSREEAPDADGGILKGMSLLPIDKRSRKHYRIPVGVDGVLIASIESGSQAEKDGFQVGDVIIQIENKVVASIKDITEALRETQDTAKRVYVNRNGMIMLLIAN
jgi:serine protease Do